MLEAPGGVGTLTVTFRAGVLVKGHQALLHGALPDCGLFSHTGADCLSPGSGTQDQGA